MSISDPIIPGLLNELIYEMARDIDVYRKLLAIPVFGLHHVSGKIKWWQKHVGIDYESTTPFICDQTS